jgi:hypothetical protein
MADPRCDTPFSTRVSLFAWLVGGILGWAVMTGIGFTVWGVGEGVVALWTNPQQSVPVVSTPWAGDAGIARILAIAPASGTASPAK